MFATKALHTIQLEVPTDRVVSQATKSSKADPDSVVRTWLKSFSAVLASHDSSRLKSVMHVNSWWRDALALSWDLRTLSGLSKIDEILSSRLREIGFSDLNVVEKGNFAPSEQKPMQGLDWVESMFTFKTHVGRGKGMVRLVQEEGGDWKAYMVYTALQELVGFEEKLGAKRPHGGYDSIPGGASKENWYERRQREKEFLDEEPTVFILGAGQSGLNLGARLQALGVSCLIADRNERVGDNWRYRYKTLVTHDPVQYTHMAYLPFPPNWPLFTPKDKLADWFESYASVMELNVWTSTTVESASFDDSTSIWTINISRNGGAIKRTLRPRYVVFCTGHSGEPRVPAISGQENFAGTVYHGSQHKEASLTGGDMSNKKVVVVGTGNSGHDIAQNYCEHGASVTMLQRSGTYVISAATGVFMLHHGLYDEGGPLTEDADIYGQSLPNAVQFALGVGLTEQIRQAEKENIDGLIKAGFNVDFGSDKSGIYRKYITRGGGYYIDVGASKLIIDGKIKIEQSPEGVREFEKDAIVLGDGRKLEADVVVLATGYDNMRTSVRKSLGPEIADRCKDVWGLDEEGEVRAMWRPSGMPNFWFMGGSLALARIYSRFVALQIKAIEQGLDQSRSEGKKE